jgi:hypothetical protein
MRLGDPTTNLSLSLGTSEVEAKLPPQESARAGKTRRHGGKDLKCSKIFPRHNGFNLMGALCILSRSHLPMSFLTRPFRSALLKKKVISLSFHQGFPPTNSVMVAFLDPIDSRAQLSLYGPNFQK